MLLLSSSEIEVLLPRLPHRSFGLILVNQVDNKEWGHGFGSKDHTDRSPFGTSSRLHVANIGRRPPYVPTLGSESSGAALTDPDILRQVHTAYLDAGAEVIIANTYSCNYHMMVSAGLVDEFAPVNRASLKLAHAARLTESNRQERSAWVAGSMSTTTLDTGLDQSVIEEAGAPCDGYRAQAQIIADVGMDFIMLEMMRDVTQTRLCLKAALETGLPVWLGFSAE